MLSIQRTARFLPIFSETQRSSCSLWTWEGRLVVAREVKSVRLDLSPPPSGDLKRIWMGVLQDLTDVKAPQDRFESVLDAAQAYTWRRDMHSGPVTILAAGGPGLPNIDNGETNLPSDDWLAKGAS